MQTECSPSLFEFEAVDGKIILPALSPSPLAPSLVENLEDARDGKGSFFRRNPL